MTTKHTPGPWTTEEGPENGIAIIADNVVLATMPEWPAKQAEQTANALLIAAAPDLLDALRWLLEIVEKCDAAGIPIAGALEGRSSQSAARAAIAQATGE